MRIAVFGADGQLGRSFRQLEANFSDFQFFFTDIEQLDICKIEEIKAYLQKNRIEVIINAAAYTAVDEAEKDRESAWRINSKAVNEIAAVAKVFNIFMVHISTDYVFDGKTNKPYMENNATKPLSVYGMTKFEGERSMRTLDMPGIIIRTSWLYSEYGNNFVKKMLDLSLQNEHIDVIMDQIGSPTYAGDLAKIILEILLQKDSIGPTQVYHYSNEGIASWYDFAVEIMQMAKRTCKIIPICSDNYQTTAKRPLYCVLDKQKIKTRFNLEIPYWRNSLEKCLLRILKP